MRTRLQLLTEGSGVLLLFQLFTALSELKKLGILHTNVTPDNVMLADEEDLRIKIINFRLAFLESEATPGIRIQAPGLRWPLRPGIGWMRG